MAQRETVLQPGSEGWRSRSRRAALHALLGASAGYVLLHPLAMAIFRGLEDSVPLSVLGPVILRSIAESFRPHMLPMGALFAILCGVAGAADGWLRGMVLDQRRQLARLVRQLEKEHAELARLHTMQQRSTRFLVHDLKTHIACIQGFAELLRTSPAVAKDAGDSDAVARILRQTRKLTDAVTDLLELSQLSEAPQLERRPVAVDQLFDETCDVFAAAVREGRLRTQHPGHGTVTVMGDRRLLLRVFCNLVSNALDHSSTTGPVELTARPDPGRPGWIEISCRDHGPGIAPDELPLVFEEFRSGRGSSGLGLAFCKAAVEAHGGSIACLSPPTGGCIFTIRLPGAGTYGEARYE